MERRATCHCGKLALVCIGEPIKVSLCHCFDCQRRTGSLFSVAAFFPKDRAKPVGGLAKVFRRGSASGFDVDFYLCGECGSNLWWEPERLPSLVGVAIGAFADRSFPMPEQAVWCDERHPWLELPDEMARHARNPARVGG